MAGRTLCEVRRVWDTLRAARRMGVYNYRCRSWPYPVQVTPHRIVFSREFSSPLYLEMECESFHMKYIWWRGTHKGEDIWNCGFHSIGWFNQKITVLDVCFEFMLLHCFTASIPLLILLTCASDPEHPSLIESLRPLTQTHWVTTCMLQNLTYIHEHQYLLLQCSCGWDFLHGESYNLKEKCGYK